MGRKRGPPRAAPSAPDVAVTAAQPGGGLLGRCLARQEQGAAFYGECLVAPAKRQRRFFGNEALYIAQLLHGAPCLRRALLAP